MYIAQAYKGLHEWWRYLVGLIIIFIAWQIVGMIPLTIVVIIKSLEVGTTPIEISQIHDLLGSNLFLFLMLLSFAFGLFGVIVASKLLHNQSFLKLTTARKKIDWKRFWFIFILWGTISSSFVLIDYFFFTPENYVLNFKLQPFLILCAIAILLIPLQTSFEEYLFRGYLMQGIGVLVKNKWLPLLITSVTFSTALNSLT